jgi:ribose transport system permease protein
MKAVTQVDEPIAPDVGATAGPARHGRVAYYAEALAMPALMLAAIVVFSLLPSTSETFPTTANLQAVLGNQAVLAIATLGVLVPLVAGEYDFSIGATLGLTAVYSASFMAHGMPLAVAALLAVMIGAGVGLVNGLLVVRARVNALIGTLATATIMTGVVQQKTHGSSIVQGIPTTLVDFGSGNTLGIPRLVYFAVATALAVYYVLAHTPLGRHLYALGSNREAAWLAGLGVDRLVVLSFVAAGVLAAIAGVLQVGRSGSGDPSVGASFTLPAFAAAVLSAAAIRPGRFNVAGALVAITFLAVLNSGLNLLGAETYVSNYINGGALILGVALAAHLGRRRM